MEDYALWKHTVATVGHGVGDDNPRVKRRNFKVIDVLNLEKTNLITSSYTMVAQRNEKDIVLQYRDDFDAVAGKSHAIISRYQGPRRQGAIIPFQYICCKGKNVVETQEVRVNLKSPTFILRRTHLSIARRLNFLAQRTAVRKASAQEHCIIRCSTNSIYEYPKRSTSRNYGELKMPSLAHHPKAPDHLRISYISRSCSSWRQDTFTFSSNVAVH